MSEPPVCTTHHFRTIPKDELCEEHAGKFVTHCAICDLTVVGTAIIHNLPGCAGHTHHPKPGL